MMKYTVKQAAEKLGLTKSRTLQICRQLGIPKFGNAFILQDEDIEAIWNTRRYVRRNLVTAFGKSKTLTQWSKETGIPYNVLWNRMVARGWDAERALSVPYSGKSKSI